MPRLGDCAETPLHRLEIVYGRLIERLSTADTQQGALRSILDNWFYALEEDVLAEGGVAEGDAEALPTRTSDLMERRLASVARHAPAFVAARRAYRRAVAGNERATAEALLAWSGGQPNVGAAAKRYAGVKGDLDVRDREDLMNSSLAPTTRCWGGRGIVRPTFSACARRRQGASLGSAPASRGLPALTAAPRTLVQTGSYRTMPNLDPLHVVFDDLSRICQFSMTVDT